MRIRGLLEPSHVGASFLCESYLWHVSPSEASRRSWGAAGAASGMYCVYGVCRGKWAVRMKRHLWVLIHLARFISCAQYQRERHRRQKFHELRQAKLRTRLYHHIRWIVEVMSAPTAGSYDDERSTSLYYSLQAAAPHNRYLYVRTMDIVYS